MATWEDGPEYAPHEPPTQFTAPETAPLSHAEPRVSHSAGAPQQAPGQFTAPQAAPLAAIGTGPAHGARNPQQPFAVHAGALTEGSSAWGAAHYAAINAEPAPQQWAPPTGSPTVATGVAAPPGPPPPPDPRQPIAVGNQPAPTAQNWAPPTGTPPAAPTTGPLWRRIVELLTWPLVASLVLGIIIPISPVMLIVSTVLAQRLDAKLRPVRIGISVGMGYVLLISLISLLGNDWWGTTSIWAWIVTLLVIVYAGAMSYLTVTGKRGTKSAHP